MTVARTEVNSLQSAADLFALIDELHAVTTEETALVRRGRLRDAAALAERKSMLAGRYLAGMIRLKTRAGEALRKDEKMKEGLQRRHAELQSQLQTNLAVLATAHAVSEDLVRGAAAEATRQAAPQAYGAHARPVAAPARIAQPVAISRSC